MIVGIDFSTHAIDLVTIPEEADGRAAAWARRRLDNGRDHDAFIAAMRVRDALPPRAHWRDSGVTTIAIERPWSRQLKSIAVLMRIQGAILATLPPTGITVMELHPQTWKKETIGRSNASKDQVAEWARAELATGSVTPPDDRWPQDAYDAYCIARAARTILETPDGGGPSE